MIRNNNSVDKQCPKATTRYGTHVLHVQDSPTTEETKVVAPEEAQLGWQREKDRRGGHCKGGCSDAVFVPNFIPSKIEFN